MKSQIADLKKKIADAREDHREAIQRLDGLQRRLGELEAGPRKPTPAAARERLAELGAAVEVEVRAPARSGRFVKVSAGVLIAVTAFITWDASRRRSRVPPPAIPVSAPAPRELGRPSEQLPVSLLPPPPVAPPPAAPLPAAPPPTVSPPAAPPPEPTPPAPPAGSAVTADEVKSAFLRSDEIRHFQERNTHLTPGKIKVQVELSPSGTVTRAAVERGGDVDSGTQEELVTSLKKVRLPSALVARGVGAGPYRFSILVQQ